MSKRARIVTLALVFVGHEYFSGFSNVVWNPGFSFSLNFAYLQIVLVGILIYLFLNSKTLPMWLLFVGGIVNFVDRIRFGAVRDYWYVPGLDVYNNFPDWVVLAGIILICWYYLKTKNS